MFLCDIRYVLYRTVKTHSGKLYAVVCYETLFKGMFDRRRCLLTALNIPDASPANVAEPRCGRRQDDAEHAQVNKWVKLANSTL